MRHVEGVAFALLAEETGKSRNIGKGFTASYILIGQKKG